MSFHNGLTLRFFIFFSIGLSALISVVSFLFAKPSENPTGTQGFECGFDPFMDTRRPVEIQFYLVGLLFLIFDLEVSFLFPWAINLIHFNLFQLNLMFIFLLILTGGYVYEWRKGGLSWT